MEPQRLVTRDELVEYLLSVIDIRDNVAAIRELLEEEDDGGEAQEEEA